MARKNRYEAPIRTSLERGTSSERPPPDDATEVTLRTRGGLLPVDDETNFASSRKGAELEAELLKVDPRALAQRLARAKGEVAETTVRAPVRRGREMPEDQPTTRGPALEGPSEANSVGSPVPIEDPAALARRLAEEAKARLARTDDLRDETARESSPGRPRTDRPAPERKSAPIDRTVRAPRQSQRPTVVRKSSPSSEPPQLNAKPAQPMSERVRAAQKRARDATPAPATPRATPAPAPSRVTPRTAPTPAPAPPRATPAPAPTRAAERPEPPRPEPARAEPSKPTPMPAPPRRTAPPHREPAPPVPHPTSPPPMVAEAAPPPEDPAALARRLAMEAKARLARSGTPAPERQSAPPLASAPLEPEPLTSTTVAPAIEPAPPVAPERSAGTSEPAPGRLADRAPRTRKPLSAAEALARFSAEPAPTRQSTPAAALGPSYTAPVEASPVPLPPPPDAQPLVRPLSLLAEILPGVLIESEHPVSNAGVFRALWEAHQARAIRAGRLQLAATATLLLYHVERGRPLLAARVGYANQQWAAFMAADDGQLLAIVDMPEIYLAGLK